MPNSPRSISRLLTLLLVLLLCYTCTRTVNGWEDPLGLEEDSLTSLTGGTRYVREYFLYAQCSERFVRMTLRRGKRALDARGRRKTDKYALLKFESVGHEGRIQILGEAANKYLCFSRRGRLILRTQTDKDGKCSFREEFDDNYIKLRSAHHKDWYVGFNKRGNKMRGYDHFRLRKQKCYLFSKLDANQPARGDYTPFSERDIKGFVDRRRRRRNRRRRIRHKKVRHNGR